MKKSLLGFMAVAMAAFGMVGPASGGVEVLEFNTHFADGTPPSGSGPWITATFTDTGVNQVGLSIVSHLLVPAEHIKEISFNFDPSLVLSGLIFNQTLDGGPTASVSTGEDFFHEDGSFGYDIQLTWATNSFGLSNPEANFVLSGPIGLAAASFHFMNLGPSSKKFFGAAHIGGTGINGEDSDFVGAESIPLPQTWLLLACGLVLVPVVRRRFGVAT